MKVVRRKRFKQLHDRGGAIHSGLRIEGATFDNCGLSLVDSPEERSTVRDVELVGCANFNSYLGPALFDEVLVDGWSSNDLCILWGPLFRRVTWKGKLLGGIKVNTTSTVRMEPAREAAFAARRRDHYEEVDWALDLSQAWFGGSAELSGVPARLVRRDPATQGVLTRARATKRGWRKKLAAWNTYWPMVIDSFLESGEPDELLIAHRSGRGDKTFRRLVDGLDDLRKAGVVEPD